MWNILIVLIIAIIIWMVNPLAHIDNKTPIGGVSEKTRQEVNQVQDEATRQVEYARQIQQQEQQNLDNN